MNERMRYLRKTLGFNQKEMGDKIKLSQTHISSLENGARDATDRIISDICREFNVNEQWLRTGEGEMFIQPETFSLDEYAQKSQLSELELDIIKSYMDLNKDVRQAILKTAQQLFAKHSEIASTVEENNDQVDIEAELERYRQELEAEKKARMLSASQKQKKDLIG
ncbi:helix-turn-helix domain-containing protein [Lysinibacillus sp. HST-98]|uniref:helix-turn-helix domain-containing protein n=1 Tax=Lysinibacillus sp. HST-98 TaxID=2800419 RepID=UPI0019280E2C|nr:helix-turn-helix transcriptional regulator [Lysinibacillus sp. HST-98]MBL3729070.1 helix-turn-helix domain-containing protein [Lysinibacillus sp. HST-98]